MMQIRRFTTLCLIVLLALTSIPLNSDSVGATTAAGYISLGKSQLFQKTVDGALAAYATFQDANSTYGAHCDNPLPSSGDCSIAEAEEKLKIHGYLAFTRLADLFFQNRC